MTAPGDHIIACTISRSWRRVTCTTWFSRDLSCRAHYTLFTEAPSRAPSPLHLQAAGRNTSRWADWMDVMIAFRLARMVGLHEGWVTPLSVVNQGSIVRLAARRFRTEVACRQKKTDRGQPTVIRFFGALLCLALILVWMFGMPACAIETRVALVVGASAYQHASHLANTVNDAKEVAAKLKHLGFEVETVMDPDRQQFEVAVRRFGQRARGADAALFFYAGHALELNGRNWLIPVQANLQAERDLRFEALDLSDVIDQVEGQARVSVVILDACRNNPFRRVLGGDSRAGDVGGGLAPQRAATGTLIVYSTALGEVAADGNGPHSPFTAALLRHLETPGIEVRQLIAEVRRDVRQATSGQQIPWESSALEGEFFLDPAPAPLSAPAPTSASTPAPGLRDAEVVLWDSVKDSHDPSDFRLYLNRYPVGIFAPLAHNRLAQFSVKTIVPEYKSSPNPSPSSPGASYQGAYFCGRRVARVTLKVLPQVGEPRRHAIFSFGPEPTSPDVPRGAFMGSKDQLTCMAAS
jgi:hypothetical protein